MSQQNYHNYTIKSQKGVFYQSSKTHLEGFDVESKTLSGATVWHKEQNELQGVLRFVEIMEFDNPGRGKVKFLKIAFNEASGASGSLLIPVFNKRRDVDDWIKAFLPALANCHKGQELIIALNRKKTQKGKDGNEYLYKNAYFKEAPDIRIDWAFMGTEAPKAVKTTDDVTGDPKWDFTPVNKWWYEKLMSVVAKFNPQGSGNNGGGTGGQGAAANAAHAPVNSATPYTGVSNDEIMGEGEYEDLPF